MSTTDKKPRADSKLRANRAVADQVRAWMLDEGLDYETIRELCQSQLNVETSLNALSKFWRAECAPVLAERNEDALRIADALIDGLDEERQTRLDRANRHALTERVLDLLTQPQVDPGATAKLLTPLLKMMTIAQDDRRLRLLEGKVQAAEAAHQKLRDPAIANDAELRQKVLDEVDRAMGIKH